MRDVLGEEAPAAWLFGSATLGGLKPESDLDVLALAARRLSGEERRALGERMLALTQRPRRLELTVVALPELRPWRFPPRLELQYGDWLRAEFERGEVEPERPESTDLAILLSLAREHGAHARPRLVHRGDGRDPLEGRRGRVGARAAAARAARAAPAGARRLPGRGGGALGRPATGVLRSTLRGSRARPGET